MGRFLIPKKKRRAVLNVEYVYDVYDVRIVRSKVSVKEKQEINKRYSQWKRLG